MGKLLNCSLYGGMFLVLLGPCFCEASGAACVDWFAKNGLRFKKPSSEVVLEVAPGKEEPLAIANVEDRRELARSQIEVSQEKVTIETPDAKVGVEGDRVSIHQSDAWIEVNENKININTSGTEIVVDSAADGTGSDKVQIDAHNRRIALGSVVTRSPPREQCT